MTVAATAITMNPNLFLAIARQHAEAADRRAQLLGPHLAALGESEQAPSRAPLTVRLDAPGDGREIAHIADLDSSVLPAPPLLVGERDGQIVAALSLRDGKTVANPYVPTADVVALLALRARQLRRDRDEDDRGLRRGVALLRLRRAAAR